jgi:hypothetical protein
MKLMTLKEWADTMFTPKSRPSRNTLYEWINNGDLPVRQIGLQYYVETGEHGLQENSTVEKARLKLVQKR